jgi:hypothetical protein
MPMNSIAKISGGSTPRRSYRKAKTSCPHEGSDVRRYLSGVIHSSFRPLDLDRVNIAVQQCCSKRHLEVVSEDGPRALTPAICLLRAKGAIGET